MLRCGVCLQLEEGAQKRRRVRKNAWLFSQMELSGLLAVCIVVLIVSMITPPVHHGSLVDLAFARHAVPIRNAVKEDAIIVTIARDGRVYFRNYRTTCNDLPRAIQEAVRHGAERKVYVKADARARYSAVEVVMDAIRLAGIANVVFLTGPSPAAFGECN